MNREKKFEKKKHENEENKRISILIILYHKNHLYVKVIIQQKFLSLPTSINLNNCNILSKRNLPHLKKKNATFIPKFMKIGLQEILHLI